MSFHDNLPAVATLDACRAAEEGEGTTLPVSLRPLPSVTRQRGLPIVASIMGLAQGAAMAVLTVLSVAAAASSDECAAPPPAAPSADIAGVVMLWGMCEVSAFHLRRAGEDGMMRLVERDMRLLFRRTVLLFAWATALTVVGTPPCYIVGGKRVDVGMLVVSAPSMPLSLAFFHAYRGLPRAWLAFVVTSIIWFVAGALTPASVPLAVVREAAVAVLCVVYALPLKLRAEGGVSPVRFYAACVVMVILCVRLAWPTNPNFSIPPAVALQLLLASCTFVCADASETARARLTEQLKSVTETRLVNQRRFVRYIFHEIRVPLNTMSVALAAARREEDGGLTLERTTSDAFSSALALVSQVLNDVLTLERVEMGRLTLRLAFVGVHSFASELRAAFAPIFGSTGVAFEVEVEGAEEGDEASVDAARVRQVASNFVSNAVKFTPAGGRVVVAIAVQEVEEDGVCSILSDPRSVLSGPRSSILPLRLPPSSPSPSSRLRRRRAAGGAGGGRFRVTVTDTGAGFPEEMQEELFMPFGKIREGEHKHIQGSGIGLSICKAIAEGHGGGVFAASAGKGRGATFGMWVPCTLRCGGRGGASSSTSSSTPATSSPSALHNLRVLLVDDSVPSCKMMAAMVRRAGAAAADVAFDGKQGLEAAAAQTYDIIITDLDMPVMDGASMTRALRAAGFGGVIVGVSGHALEEDKRFMIESGMDEVLSKPVTLAMVCKACRG